MSPKVCWIPKMGLIVALFFASVLATNACSAQTIQLPTLQQFNIDTTVSVPDGGIIRLGGVNRSQSGSINLGVPGLSGVPGLNRGFGNQAFGRSTTSSQASIKADLIIMSELEAEVMAEAKRRQALRQEKSPNGSQAIQKKADFISRHIGK